MNLTLNGIPVTIDPAAAEDILRRHLLGIIDEPGGAEALAMRSTGVRLPDQPLVRLNEGEKLIGSYAGPDGKTTVAVLLAGEKSSVNWKDALRWANDQGGDLPNRIEALLLFQHHRDEFQREVYWTNEQYAAGGSCAWSQGFLNGTQGLWHQSDEDMARAVRRITI